MVYLHPFHTNHAYDVATFELARELFFKRVSMDSFRWSPQERDTTSSKSKAHTAEGPYKVTSWMLQLQEA
jgi:hypothetical protein